MTEPFNTNRILVSGTGKMGKPLILGIRQDPRYDLLPLVISDEIGDSIKVGDDEFTIIHLNERLLAIPWLLDEYGPTIVLDVVPKTVSQGNAEFYSQFEMPVIMMSTGVTDLAKVRNTLVLPNACLQIMAWEKFITDQSEIAEFGNEYSLAVEESHQASKIDVSGTALKITPRFRCLGLEFDDANIISLRSEEDYSRIGIPMSFYGAHAYHKYTISSTIEQDMRLRIFFSRAEDFFSDNVLFKQLDFYEANPGGNTSNYNDKTILWGSQLLDPIGYRTFVFGIHLVEAKNNTKVEFFHTILGHEPYVKGVLNNALPFMQEKCMNGLNGENFTSLQLYDWVMNR